MAHEAGFGQALGAMSACSQKQLGVVFAADCPAAERDARGHAAKVVRRGDTRALKARGEVIRNPEIRGLSPALLGAIAKPRS